MQLIRFSHFGEGVVHGISTRHGGVSTGHLDSLNLGLQVGDEQKNIEENFRLFFDALGVSGEKLAIAYQRHTDEIVDIDADFSRDLNNPFNAVDGFVCNVTEVPLVVRFADCQGVLFYDPVAKVVAAVHSGWRGNVKNIIGKCLRKMQDEYGCDPKNILVGLSQSLGRCCSEFSDPYNELPEFMHKYIDERNHVDLWQCAEDQILSEDVPAKNVEILRRCTVCENEKFFSHRGGKGKTGHMAAVIMLK